MAQTQMIECVTCGKPLGILDFASGDFKNVFLAQGKTEIFVAGDKKNPDKAVKRIISKDGYKADKRSKYNLVDNATGDINPTVTCSCGQVNGLY